MNEFPQIFTFYSFKGGVGRSMAVLNVAYALVAKGRNVLVLDMDLEAPGLSGFLRRHREIGDFARQDMVDLVRWATDFSIASQQASEPLDAASFPPLTDFIVSVPRDKLDPLPHPYCELGRLDIIPVDEERDYYGRLTSLAMGSFEQDALVRVGSILHAWLKSRRFAMEVPEYYGPDADRTAAYDHVLVDSRTGVTETGGLCIGPLSDQLVVLTALNDQNVQGTRRFLEEVGILAKPPSMPSDDRAGGEMPAHRLDPKPTLIVASPVPAGETETKRERLQQLEAAVGKPVVKLSYHPQMALLESIFTRDYRDEYLADEYGALAGQVLSVEKNGTDLFKLFEKCVVPFWSPSGLRDAARAFLRSVPVVWTPILGRSFAALEVLLTMLDFKQLTDDLDFILWDRVWRVLSSSGRETRFHVLLTWATMLSRWSLCTEQPQLAALRREAAMRCYDQMLQSQDAPAEQKAQTLVNRGWTHFLAGRNREAIEDEQQAAALDPENCRARGVLAIALLVHGRRSEAMATYDEALNIAKAEDLAEMSSDIQMAVGQHGPLDGADEALIRIQARRKSLER